MLGVLPAGLSAQTPPLPAALPEDFLPGLRNILDSAMQCSPQMIARNIDLATQEANRYQPTSQEWPNLSGGISYLYNQSGLASSTAANTESKGLFYNLNFSQPIYHWGALQAAADIAHLQIKISEHQYADAYRQLATTIRSQYLSLIVQKVEMRNLHFALNQAETSLAVVQDRLKNKAAAEGDVYTAKLAVDDASLALDRTVEDFAHAKRVLLLTAGLPELSDDAVPEEIPKPVYPADTPAALLEDFSRRGLDQTLQAQIYDDEIKQSDLNYKIAKYRLFPRLDLNFGVSEQNETQVINQTVGGVVDQTVYQNPIFSKTATLAATWSIFDGFATRGAKLTALANKRASERSLQTYLDQTLEQARYLERQVEFSARAMALAEQRFADSGNSLQRAKDNLKLGFGSQATVDQATANFYQWQVAAFGARSDYFSRWSDYLSLLGIDPVLNNLPAHFINNAK